MNKPYKLVNGYVSPRKEDLKKLVEIGWIDEIDDWQADIECYGSHDSYNNNCDECPLEEPCLLIKSYDEDHY